MDRGRIGRPAAFSLGEPPLQDFLAHQKFAHFREELIVEPIYDPPHIGPHSRIRRHQAPVGGREPSCLLDIFGDHHRAGQWEIVFNQNRCRTCRIEREEFWPPLHYFFFGQIDAYAIFAQHEPNEARMGAKGVMKEFHEWESGDERQNATDQGFREANFLNYSLA